MKYLSSTGGLPNMILAFCLYVSLFRGTYMGLFYPAAESEIGGIDYTYQTVMSGILLVGMCSYFFLKNNYKDIIYVLSKPLPLLITCGALVSLALSVDVGQSIKVLVATLVLTLPIFLYHREHGYEGLLEVFAKFMIFVTVANIVYTILFPQYAFMVGNHDGAWRGLFEHKNPAGAIMGLGGFIIWNKIGSKSGLQYALYAVCILTCFLFSAISLSSTAWITTSFMGVLYLLFFFLLSINSPKERIAIILFFLGAVTLVYMLWGSDIADGFFDIIGKDRTFTGRTGVWSAIFKLVEDRPLFGFGPGVAEQVDFMKQIQGEVGWEVKSMHNSYLDILVSYGYPVTVLLLAGVFFAILKNLTSFVSSENRRKVSCLAIGNAMILDMMMECFTESGGFLGRSIIWLFIFAGLCIISSVDVDQNDRHKEIASEGKNEIS